MAGKSGASRLISLAIVVVGLMGAGGSIYLFVRHGWNDIVHVVLTAGWGVVAVVAFHAVPMFCDVMGWRVLLPANHRLSFGRMYLIRWIGDSVSAMLPVAQVGGEIVRVRLATKDGMRLSMAAASVLVAMTVSVFTQIPFTLSGLILLIPESKKETPVLPIFAGVLISLLGVAGFYIVQRVGMFRMSAKIISHLSNSDAWKDLVARGEELDADVRSLYDRKRELCVSAMWNMACWATGAVEVWIALRAMGIHASYAQAYILESISQGIRSVMFLVPGGLGVQEGGYLGVGSLLGLSSPVALALALVRRIRELAVGLPGIMAWQWMEWRHQADKHPSLPPAAVI